MTEMEEVFEDTWPGTDIFRGDFIVEVPPGVGVVVRGGVVRDGVDPRRA